MLPSNRHLSEMRCVLKMLLLFLKHSVINVNWTVSVYPSFMSCLYDSRIRLALKMTVGHSIGTAVANNLLRRLSFQLRFYFRAVVQQKSSLINAEEFLRIVMNYRLNNSSTIFLFIPSIPPKFEGNINFSLRQQRNSFYRFFYFSMDVLNYSFSKCESIRTKLI